MSFGSIGSEFHFPNAQLPQCGFVCYMIQSQTPIVCISSSRQSCLNDGCIVNGLELSSCICIPTDNSDTIYTSQDSTISVQKSSYCSYLAPMSEVLQILVSAPILFHSFQNYCYKQKESFNIQISHYSFFTLGNYQTIN